MHPKARIQARPETVESAASRSQNEPRLLWSGRAEYLLVGQPRPTHVCSSGLLRTT